MELQGELSWQTFPRGRIKVMLMAPVATVVGGKVYVHGGFGTRSYPLFAFILRTRKWKQLKGCKYRYAHNCALVDDKLFILGGARDGVYNLPIEAYDLTLGEVETLERCRLTVRVAAFVERVGEIIIVGNRRLNTALEVVGLNVYDKKFAAFKTTGEQPSNSPGQALVVCEQKLFLLSPNPDRRSILYVLSFGVVRTATWSKLQTFGTLLPCLRYSALQVVDSLILCFGGVDANHLPTRDLYVVDPKTGIVSVARSSTVSSTNHGLKIHGTWPAANAKMGSASAQDRMWLFGGRDGGHITELKFRQK